MSHVSTSKTSIKSQQTLTNVCNRLKRELGAAAAGAFEKPEYVVNYPLGIDSQTRRMREVTGHAVQLPGWLKKVVYDLETGEESYDNFSGIWGDAKELTRLHNEYAKQALMDEATKQGQRFTCQQVDEETVKFEIYAYEGV